MRYKYIILKQSFPFDGAKVERLFDTGKLIQRNAVFFKRNVDFCFMSKTPFHLYLPCPPDT